MLSVLRGDTRPRTPAAPLLQAQASDYFPAPARMTKQLTAESYLAVEWGVMYLSQTLNIEP
jgi:hypothetical protein